MVRNSTHNHNPMVNGIGLNPNTGRSIKDDIVGYVDNEGICFANEGIRYKFISIPDVNVDPRR